MLQKEFFERTGINLTEQEFNQVHAMYLESGQNMDKDQFCADWKSTMIASSSTSSTTRQTA